MGRPRGEAERRGGREEERPRRVDAEERPRPRSAPNVADLTAAARLWPSRYYAPPPVGYEQYQQMQPPPQQMQAYAQPPQAYYAPPPAGYAAPASPAGYAAGAPPAASHSLRFASIVRCTMTGMRGSRSPK